MTPLAVCDWRTAPAAEILPLWVWETSRWRTLLDWDARRTWAVAEQARQAGSLPGVILSGPDRRIAGWSYFLRHGETLQIGALHATSVPETDRLLDAVLDSPEARQAGQTMLFAFAAAPGLDEALRARGFVVDRYDYLRAAVEGDGTLGPAQAPGFDSWRAGDATAMAELCRVAYPPVDDARPFALGNDSASWHEYITQLQDTQACGVFLPGCSYVVREHGRAVAAAMVSTIGAGVAHLSQIAVDPRVQGQGIGRRLLDHVRSAAALSGYSRITLLVSERNLAARRLYAGQGFEATASFLSAVGAQPRRSTRAALESGGAITFR